MSTCDLGIAAHPESGWNRPTDPVPGGTITGYCLRDNGAG